MQDSFQKLLDEFAAFLTAACTQYEFLAPTVHAHCDELYIRLSEDMRSVSLAEMSCVLGLREDGQWEQSNYAANRIYKLRERLAMTTTGHAGF